MERPNTVFGLASHLVRQRWSQLGGRGRLLVVALGIATAAAGAHAVCGGGACGACCHHGETSVASAP